MNQSIKEKYIKLLKIIRVDGKDLKWKIVDKNRQIKMVSNCDETIGMNYWFTALWWYGQSIQSTTWWELKDNEWEEFPSNTAPKIPCRMLYKSISFNYVIKELQKKLKLTDMEFELWLEEKIIEFI